MNDALLDDMAIERAITTQFGQSLDVDSVILRHVPVSRTAWATLFLTKKKQLFLYVTSQSPLLLGDVKKIVSRMGLKAGNFVPPKDQPDYFNDVARRKFEEVFPGRKAVSEEDLLFYKTLVPYKPALILIHEVEAGEVFQFDPDSRSGWRSAIKFTYRRIATS